LVRSPIFGVQLKWVTHVGPVRADALASGVASAGAVSTVTAFRRAASSSCLAAASWSRRAWTSLRGEARDLPPQLAGIGFTESRVERRQCVAFPHDVAPP
jgi:hypothetical protein